MGELLWDSLPAGLFLGGAPCNVACHLRSMGVQADLISRVGVDRLGAEALLRTARHGISNELVQVDARLPTGFVEVRLDEGGAGTYRICGPAAWDEIETTESLLYRTSTARAIVFGSLAQRSQTSRATIELMGDSEALQVFDVNLRPPHDDPDVIRRSLGRADVVKLSDSEMLQLASWYSFEGSEREISAAIAESFSCSTVCVTRGARGAALWVDGRWTEHPGFSVAVLDTVGAGDAFLAALLVARFSGANDELMLEQANRMGAYVASIKGAVPPAGGSLPSTSPLTPRGTRPNIARSGR